MSCPHRGLLALSACAALSLPAGAAPVLIDFDSVTSFASVDDHYNGGTDSAGASGAALGVHFGADALGLANDALGPYYSHAPSPLGVMAVVGAAATLDMAQGFSQSISLYYASSRAVADAVQVWSGSQGTGTLLASLSLLANAQAGGCSDSPYCHFDLLSTGFNGTAKSITFGNAAGVAAFDNISLNTAAAVPEPATLALAALCLAGLGLQRRRP